MSENPPGWYCDPAEPTTQRYWDGEGWLGESLPLQATPPPGPLNAVRPAPRPAPPAPPASLATPRPGYPLPPGYPVPPGQPGWPARPTPPQPHGFPLADPGLRFLARVIDTVALLGLILVVNSWFIYLWWRDSWPVIVEINRRLAANQPLTDVTPSDRATTLEFVMLFVGIALWFAYEVPALANSGQTLGKRLVGIRVLRIEADGPLGFGRALRRWYRLGLAGLLCTPITCGIGFVLLFVDCLFVAIDRPLHRALHDRSAATVVVAVPRGRAAKANAS